MSDTVITIVAIFLAAILMFIFPLVSMSDRTDDVSQLVAQTATTEFVNKVITKGKLIPEYLDEFISTLATTGHTYDIEMQIQYIDENPGVKLTQAEPTKEGENTTYNLETTQIEEELDKNGVVKVPSKARFTVGAKNTDLSISEQLKGFLYSGIGNDRYAPIVTRATAVSGVN